MKKLPLVALATTVLLASCSDETTVYSDPQEDITIDNSASGLLNSISFENSGVLDIYENEELSGKTAKSNMEEAGDYPLTLVAQVTPPSNLTASHIDMDGDYAYVAYNTTGEVFYGGLDIVDVRDPHNPQVTSRLYYESADINAVRYENGYVYAVGGVDAEKSITATSNAFVAKIPVSGGQFGATTEIIYGYQTGFNATDVQITADKVIVGSGKDGSITVYDKATMELLQEAPFADIRSLAVQNEVVAILDASTGVNFLDQNLQVTKQFGISSDFGDSAKRTLDFYGADSFIVAEGSKGAGIYDNDSGDLLQYVPILINPSGVDNADIVTNAVASNENVMLMANGGAGLCISEKQDDNTELYGVVALNGSINYVASKGDYIFAASGKAGLQIVKLNRPSTSLAAQCATSPTYKGSANLNVANDQNLAYSGSKRFNTLNVNGSLLLCGSWTVKETVAIHDNALLEMNGTMVVARNNKRKDLILFEGATLRVEGNLTVYGDLILTTGATLEFVGENSVVNVFGTVLQASNSEIIGTFRDVQNKF